MARLDALFLVAAFLACASGFFMMNDIDIVTGGRGNADRPVRQFKTSKHCGASSAPATHVQQQRKCSHQEVRLNRLQGRRS